MHKKAIISDIAQPFQIVTSPLDKPPAGHIRIRTAFAGVCHTDMGIKNEDFLNIRETYGKIPRAGLSLCGAPGCA